MRIAKVAKENTPPMIKWCESHMDWEDGIHHFTQLTSIDDIAAYLIENKLDMGVLITPHDYDELFFMNDNEFVHFKLNWFNHVLE